ncbi:MAG: tetratricopeptide repeat protein [Phycisphaeraceae bacterium]|jgi:tetratricopeptide (TPR) repeat protein|nr:tetratricopeptide repeat protein [Phycisphaeraceae bacterium]
MHESAVMDVPMQKYTSASARGCVWPDTYWRRSRINVCTFILCAVITAGAAADPVEEHAVRVAAVHTPIDDVGVAQLHLLPDEGPAIHEYLAAAASVNEAHPLVVKARFEQAMAGHDWSQAHDLAQLAADLNLDSAQGHRYAGLLAMARGRWVKAAAALDRAVALRPVYAQNWRLLARAQRAVPDPYGAIDSYGKVIALLPDDVDAWQGLAKTCRDVGAYPQALAAFGRAVELNETDRAVLEDYIDCERAHGRVEMAVAARQRLAKRWPRDPANERAIIELQAMLGHHAEAIASVSRLKRVEGNTHAVASALAMVHHLAGDAQRANDVLEQFIESQGAQVTVDDLIAKGRFYLDTGQVTQSFEAYHEAIAIEDPATRRATAALANVLFNLGHPAQAATLYRRVWSDDAPASAERIELGHHFVEALILSRDLAGARQVLDNLTAREGLDQHSYVLEGLLAAAQAHTADAVAMFNRAIEFDPQHGRAYFERARLFVRESRPKNHVFADLHRAILFAPDFVPAYQVLAGMFWRQDQPVEAARRLERLLAHRLRHLASRRQLAQIYVVMDRADLLANLVNTSRRLFPYDPSWSMLHGRLSQGLLSSTAPNTHQPIVAGTIAD